MIKRIRSAGIKIPIIVLSSRSGERQKVEALELGADDYVTKPFGIAELVARIARRFGIAFRSKAASPFFRAEACAWTSCGAS